MGILHSASMGIISETWYFFFSFFFFLNMGVGMSACPQRCVRYAGAGAGAAGLVDAKMWTLGLW